MGHKLPAISGNELIRLLKKDGWEITGQNSHVVKMRKKFPDRTRVTIVQPISDSLRNGTLSQILSEKQTNVGRDGLEALIKKHGLK